MKIIIRTIDFLASMIVLLVLMPVVIILYIIGLFDTGKPLFIQTRVGKNKIPFKLIKFRTMNLETGDMGTHLVGSSNVTKYGSFLRKSKLDELPQLLNVMFGDMSLVGPRPCLFNQLELIEERSFRGVFDVRPGITGLAQVNNIDMSTPQLLAETDRDMIVDFSVVKYFQLIFYTLGGNGFEDKVVKK